MDSQEVYVVGVLEGLERVMALGGSAVGMWRGRKEMEFLNRYGLRGVDRFCCFVMWLIRVRVGGGGSSQAGVACA